MNIFFDLDGTLIDSKDRLYQLFQHLVPQSGLTYDKYWQLKQNKISHKQILAGQFNYTNEEFATFEANWMARIELKEWLALDKPFNGVGAYLKKLAKQHTLYLVTSRQSEENTLKQITGYGWTPLFKQLLVTKQKIEKAELLKEIEIDANDWFVGDTGKDIQTGKKLGIKTAAVLSGFLNKEKLGEYKPDVIEFNVTDIKF